MNVQTKETKAPANPAGQFLYVEQQSSQPIAAALAARLAAG